MKHLFFNSRGLVDVDQRHVRSIGTLTVEELQHLKMCRVAVVGCGGLGGYVLEMLGRMGVGYLTAIDGDVFEESNLNRQILSETEMLGWSKAEVARLRMNRVNPEVVVFPVRDWLVEDNAESLLAGHDVVVDALDSISARFTVQGSCEKLQVPMVHGAIGGWYGQLTVIFPGDRTLNKLYSKDQSKGVESKLGNPSFTPALIASIQAAETVKLLIGRGESLRNRVLRVDLLEQEYSVLDL
jgi:molybdopterin-synthase adenylyltransferase